MPLPYMSPNVLGSISGFRFRLWGFRVQGLGFNKVEGFLVLKAEGLDSLKLSV